MSSYTVPDLSSPPPPTLCKQTPNHPHLTLQMSKPSQSSTPHHISNTINTKKVHKSSLRFLSFKDTPHIHLTIIRSVLSKLLRSSAFIAHVFSSIYQHTLDTSTIDPSFDTIRCTTHSQNRRKLLELSPSTSHSSSSRFHYTPTRT